MTLTAQLRAWKTEGGGELKGFLAQSGRNESLRPIAPNQSHKQLKVSYFISLSVC